METEPPSAIDPRAMRLEDFDFTLPESLIARYPVEPRDSSRLLCVDRSSGERRHSKFDALSELLKPGDLIVLNETRVLPARLYGRTQHGGRIELLLLKELDSERPRWSCLARPGKKIPSDGIRLEMPDGSEAVAFRTGEKEFEVHFVSLTRDQFLPWLEKNGEMPLPPYLKREAESGDAVRYQTVFARKAGSVAAPTAGLHFTEALIERLKAQGVGLAKVTLHIGYGTFSPLTEEALQGEQLHEETYDVPPETLTAVEATRKRGGRIIPVGTTAMRTLESAVRWGPTGTTRIFIKPGFEFRVADGLITNFHLPQSSLFVLVSGFLGLDRTHECYREAMSMGYRFYSYGDAMAIL